MPSPTRAMMVSSVAPPTKRSRLERTVTRADGDTVLGDAVDGALAGGGPRAVDDARIHAGADGVKDGLAGAGGGEVDGAATVEVELDPGLVRGDEGADHLVHVTPREKVRFQLGRGYLNPCADGGDAGVDDEGIRDAPQTHSNQGGDTDGRPGSESPEPEAKEVQEDDSKNQGNHPGGDEEN
jgi:hypothetical protein